MINLVGCAPSSGSTFFADLLDSSGQTACGEELNLFAMKRFYDFHKFKQKQNSKSLSSIYLYRESLNRDVLHHYGLNESEFKRLVDSSESVDAFIREFTRYYLVLRGKCENGVVFEKTPQNIICIDRFLSSCPESFFIFIVRNPLFVYDSMRRRGFTPYIALATWFIECSRYFHFRDHPRVLLVRYEDLVREPYKLTSNIFKRTAQINKLPEEIETYYKNNPYRKLFSIRMKSWQTKEIGKVVDCNAYKIDRNILEEFSCFNCMMMHPNYRRKFNIPDVHPAGLLDYFGYTDEVSNQLAEIKDVNLKKIRIKNNGDIVRLFIKWSMALHLKEASISDLPCFLSPIIINHDGQKK